MTADKDELVTGLSAVLALLLHVPLALYGGWVEWLFWGWFLVPAGLPLLSYKTIVGVGFTISLFTYHVNGAEKDGDSLERMGRAFGYYSVAVVFGWLWHFWITP